MVTDCEPTRLAENESTSETQEVAFGQSDHDTSDGSERSVSEGAELPYRVVEHTTREEWLAWRAGKIGASDMGAIMGVSPFISRFDLMQVKLGLKKTRDNSAMAHGRALEDSVLRILKLRLKDKDIKSVTCESTRAPFMVAQLDGFSDKNLLEIKCPVSPKLLREISNGGIPLHYLYQLQAQMYVTGRMESTFCVYFEHDLHTFEVPADIHLQTQLVTAAEQFLADIALARSRSAR
jgi:putative phage-type endonuclease